MKKLFTLFAAAALSVSAFATDYAGKITVSVNGEGGTQDATINITQNADETYKLSIKNFVLVNGDSQIGVGNIVLDNMKGYPVNGLITIVADQVVHITEGDDPNIPFWIGPGLDEVGGAPIIMTAQFDDTNAKADIDIDMRNIIQQFINVKFNTQEEGQGSGVYGDVNNDGSVNSADVTEVYNILLGN